MAKKRSPISRLLEEHRKRKGMSALELSRLAGLGVNYVRTIEKDDRCPREDQVKKLVRALDLPPSEEVEFYQAWQRSGVSEETREALAGLALPGLVLWKHFPEALYSVEHDATWLFPLAQDMAFFHAVTSCGSLLSCVPLLRHPPPNRVLKGIRKSAERIIDEPQYEGIVNLPGMREHIIGLALPSFWRAELFGTKAQAERRTRQLSQWAYKVKDFGQLKGEITVEFSDNDQNERWGVRDAKPEDVVSWHDAMIAHLLWEPLGLAEDFAPLDVSFYRARCSTAVIVLEALKASPDELEKSILERIEKDGPSATADTLLGRSNLIMFSMRALEIPSFADRVFGENHGLTRDLMQTKATQLLELVVELKKHHLASLPEPTPGE